MKNPRWQTIAKIHTTSVRICFYFYTSDARRFEDAFGYTTCTRRWAIGTEFIAGDITVENTMLRSGISLFF